MCGSGHTVLTGFSKRRHLASRMLSRTVASDQLPRVVIIILFFYI